MKPTAPENHWWKVSLRLNLRQSSGIHFQEFFSAFMENLHGSDYVRVRAYGATGDKGCDGYLRSSGAVFQCYGALNGSPTKAAYLIDKMESDFQKALTSLSSIMKEWRMVHNLVDGLPIAAVEKLHEIQNTNPSIPCAFFGLERFEHHLTELTTDQTNSLLGPAATNHDAQNLQMEELRSLITSLMESAEHTPASATTIQPVPRDKLQANELPFYWYSLISAGWQNAHLVSAYFNNHHDPLRGETIAAMFRERYQYLRAQDLSPESVMDALYEHIVGIGTVHPARQVAAQALLAHLFESCEIFEMLSEAQMS